MKKMNFLAVLCLLISQNVFSQNADENFYTLMDSLYQNDSSLMVHDSLKSGSAKDIDRMKLIWGPRLSPSGNASDAASAIVAYTNSFNSSAGSNNMNLSWTAEGPISNQQDPRAGQINRITFDTKYNLGSNKTIYAGSFFGGLWKSIDDGLNWTSLNTDEQLPQTSIAGIAVGYQDPQKIYVCTGQGDGIYYLKTNLGGASHPIYTNGIYRSMDGGTTWGDINQGFLSNFNQGGTCRNIEIDYTSDDVLYVATTKGVYKTTNATTSSIWTKLNIPSTSLNEDFNGLKIHPTNNSIIYAASDDIYKSADAGVTWTNISSNAQLDISTLPHGFKVRRIKLEVSPAKPDRLYAYINGRDISTGVLRQVAYIYMLNDQNKWEQIHYQNDNGNAFINLYPTWMGFAVSPLDADKVYYGNARVFGSDDISVPNSFSEKAEYAINPLMAFGADVHELVFQPNTINPDLFCGNHWGINVKDANSTSYNGWSFRNNGLNNRLVWSFDVSRLNPKMNRIIGYQDLGLDIIDNNSIFLQIHGDGYTAQIFNEEKQSTYPYHKYFYQCSNIKSYSVFKPIDGAKVAYNNSTMRRAAVPKQAQIKEHPVTNKPVFGFNDLYTLPNSFTGAYLPPYPGISDWTIESDFYTGPFDPYHYFESRRVKEFEISKSNSDLVYVATFGHDTHGKVTNLYRSTTGLKNGVYESMIPGAQAPNIQFENITNKLPKVNIAGVLSAPYITGIAIDPSNSDNSWLSLSGFNPNKILKTTDGGDNWYPDNNGLPNMPANDLVLQEGTDNRLYLATDAGVYMKEGTSTSWIKLGGIPNCKVYELRINYCENKLFAATYGRGIWSTDLLPSNGFNSEREIATNTTYADDQILESNLRVKAGARLTITGTLYMPQGGKIFVEQNAELVVDGGTITNNCGKFWESIEVFGTYNQNQTDLHSTNGMALHQGKVILKNGATLERGRNAIALWELDDWSTTGGIVQAEDANFIDCRRSVSFLSYSFSNQSYFKRTNFEITRNHNYTSDNDFHAHVTLYDVKDVQFLGCSFKNEHSFDQFSTYSDKGIFSIDAGFYVGPDCNSASTISPCNGIWTKSSFSDLSIGIHATGSSSSNSIEVVETDFVDNAIGVMVEGLNHTSFTLNNVTIDDVQKTGYIGTAFDEQMGFYFINSTDYKIEENVFEKTGNNTKTTGLRIDDSGENANEVYKNEFKNLDHGQYYFGLNRHKSKNFQGLQFLCNINSVTNIKDVYISKNIENDDHVNDGIRRNQGSGNANRGLMVAENVFSLNPTHSFGHIQNTSDNFINYFYDDASIRPSNITTGKVKLKNVLTENGCPTRNYSDEPIDDGIEMSEVGIEILESKRNFYNDLLNNYNQLIDGGNTQGLIQNIRTTSPEQALQLRDLLMAKAPYLSMKSLKEAANTGVLTDAYLLEVCLANKEATLNEAFLDFLEFEIPNPLPKSMVQLIYQNWAVETSRSLLEYELADLNAELGNMSNNLIRDYNNDKLDHKEEIKKIHMGRNTLESKYRLIELNIEDRDFEAINPIITEIESRFDIAEDYQEEHNNLVNYANLRKNINSSGQNLMDLDENYLNGLRVIASKKDGRSSNLAQNILCFGYAECEGNASKGDLVSKSRRIYDLNESISENVAFNSINVVPNPTSDYVLIKTDGLELSNTRIVIFNVLGEMVMNRLISNNNQKLNLNYLDKGVYLYHIIKDETELIQRDKIIVN